MPYPIRSGLYHNRKLNNNTQKWIWSDYGRETTRHTKAGKRQEEEAEEKLEEYWWRPLFVQCFGFVCLLGLRFLSLCFCLSLVSKQEEYLSLFLCLTWSCFFGGAFLSAIMIIIYNAIVWCFCDVCVCDVCSKNRVYTNSRRELVPGRVRNSLRIAST